MGRFISFGSTPHYCPVPKWRERRRHRVKEGAIWECDCGVQWQWIYDTGGDGYWSKVFVMPVVPEGPAPGASSV